MIYSLDIQEKAYSRFKKLERKNKKQLEIINKKVKEILENPEHYKPLKGDMKGSRRVHIDKSFVLVCEIDYENKVVRILDYDHHDNIYN